MKVKMKIESLSKKELAEFCRLLGIDPKGKVKKELVLEVIDFQKSEIDEAIENGTDLDLLISKITKLADEYAFNLKNKINNRKDEMKADNTDHYLIYRVLGISISEGILIDEYQNTGRFLYKYAGSFLEEVASLCLFFANSKGGKTTIENTESRRPKTFEIDFLNNNDAIEIKWRDATTDGDHITKEHTRVKAINKKGLKPIRVMFYYPQREQAIKIQDALKAIYLSIGGEYYSGDDAWDYIKNKSGYDLKSILTEIAEKRDNETNKN